MSASNEEILNSVRNYQRSIDKYSPYGNTYKLIGIIEKLKRLPIATFHLEETGIGRTVNALRKLGGEVGDAAKGLVASWKEMVMREEVKHKENAVEEIANEARINENDNDCHDEKESSCREEETEEEDRQYLEKQSSSSHKSSDTERKGSERHEKDKTKYSSNNGSGSSHEKKEKHQDIDSSSKKRTKSNSSSDERISKRHHYSSGFESEEGVSEGTHSTSMSKRNRDTESSENEDERDRKYKSKRSRHTKDSSDSEDSYKRHKSSKSSRDSSSRKSNSREKTESKKQHYDSSSDRETDKSKSKHRSYSKSRRESDCEEDKSGSRHKSKKSCESSSDNEEAKRKSKHDSKSRHDKDSSKSKESKSHSSRSDKHEKKDKKESKRDESKEKHSYKKAESRSHEEKRRKSEDEKETDKKQKSSSSSKLEESSKPSSSSSNHKSSSEKKKDKVKLPKPVNTEKIMNGIDSGSGASFAEALGMCGPMVSKSSSTSSKKKSSSLPSYEKPRSSSSHVRPEKTEEEDTVPILLKEQPQEPININISSLLPDITPNYRPVGFPIDALPKRMLSQDEALSQAISNKNIRTKVYSGNKSFGKVETLFDLCVRILQDNIDALEYTGGVPFLILKPVLERATPDQLFNMEHHNPYLIEDTDDLWQLHCQKEFRNKKREELECWREMYMRCLNEREARLNAITANIKQSQDKSTPIRTTKLAYIDSVVKPPRNIARKQAKNGIAFDKKPAQTPASRVAALASHADPKRVAVPNPGNRAVERSSSHTAAAVKPKKAPLMAKTLSFMKNRFRR